MQRASCWGSLRRKSTSSESTPNARLSHVIESPSRDGERLRGLDEGTLSFPKSPSSCGRRNSWEDRSTAIAHPKRTHARSDKRHPVSDARGLQVWAVLRISSLPSLPDPISVNELTCANVMTRVGRRQAFSFTFEQILQIQDGGGLDGWGG